MCVDWQFAGFRQVCVPDGCCRRIPEAGDKCCASCGFLVHLDKCEFMTAVSVDHPFGVEGKTTVAVDVLIRGATDFSRRAPHTNVDQHGIRTFAPVDPPVLGALAAMDELLKKVANDWLEFLNCGCAPLSADIRRILESRRRRHIGYFRRFCFTRVADITYSAAPNLNDSAFANGMMMTVGQKVIAPHSQIKRWTPEWHPELSIVFVLPFQGKYCISRSRDQ